MIILELREEERLWKMGFRVIAGVDEVGRGALAGPVVAAVCSITDFTKFAQCREVKRIVKSVRDSKILTPASREVLFSQILRLPFFEIATSSVGPVAIDRMNVRLATLRAMVHAAKRLRQKPSILLIDGVDRIPLDLPQYTYIRGDANIFLIAAASIVAKVTRDRLMVRIGRKYPKWAFDVHKGYGTPLHRMRLCRYGPSPVHRRSFLAL